MSTEPASTETIAYLDGGVDRIAGVSDKCDYPYEVMAKPKVVRTVLSIDENLPSGEIDRIYREYVRSGKPLYEIDWALIEDIDPDLIVGQTLCSVCAFPLLSPLGSSINAKMPAMVLRYAQRFKSLRPRMIATYSPKTFLGIAREALAISRMIGREERGLRMLWEFQRALEELRGLGNSSKTLLIEWLKPLYIGGLWVSDLIEASGSRSILGAGEEGRAIEWELVKEFDPDLILISPCGFSMERTIREIDLVTKMPGWNELKAVRSKRVYVVDSAYVSRPGPRVIRLAKLLVDLYTGNDYDKEVAINIYD
ncbi:MAG TPA: ABC transporter substrate-binding protein [Sulfolobales archaeon]|nr:ABC transporter substrate-binding protein [Sulfolobales archaeon]